MKNMRIQIGIVDDHPLFREGVTRTLQAERDFEVVGQAVNAAQAVRLACEARPDVMLLDLTIQGGGLNAVRTILAGTPSIRVIVLTALEAEQDVVAALQAGVGGYILKRVSGEELVRAVRAVYAGETYVTPALAASLLVEMKHGHASSTAVDLLDGLTVREHEILAQVATGLSNKEIARRLVLSEQTIKHYVTNILQKLQVRNRVEAALLAQSGGFKHYDSRS